MTHPLSQFLYCPQCGSAHFEINDEKSKKCAQCGFVYYFNSAAATVAFILNEKEELLVCRRAKEPAKGTLDLPGGFIDMHETAEEGVAREVKEENRTEGRSSRLSVYHPQRVHLLGICRTYTRLVFPVHRERPHPDDSHGRRGRLFLCAAQQHPSRRFRTGLRAEGSRTISR